MTRLGRFEEEFTVTEDHIKLLERLCFEWVEGENKAPAVNSKRPFGNSDLEGDILEVTGRMTFEEIEEYEGDIPEDELEWAETIYQGMVTVLEIAMRRAAVGVVPGTYRCDKYRRDWTLIED